MEKDLKVKQQEVYIQKLMKICKDQKSKIDKYRQRRKIGSREMSIEMSPEKVKQKHKQEPELEQQKQENQK